MYAIRSYYAHRPEPDVGVVDARGAGGFGKLAHVEIRPRGKVNLFAEPY